MTEPTKIVFCGFEFEMRDSIISSLLDGIEPRNYRRFIPISGIEVISIDESKKLSCAEWDRYSEKWNYMRQGYLSKVDNVIIVDKNKDTINAYNAAVTALSHNADVQIISDIGCIIK